MERSRTITTGSLVRLCDEGRYEDAWSVASQWPAGPERSLIHGASLMLDLPEQAKDSLSVAARLLDGELSERALIWLSSCYWVIGEKEEARTTLESVVPTSDTTRFSTALMRSIIESGDVKAAMLVLDEVEALAESMGSLLRGKFLNQRGYLRRRVNDIDGAIVAYEEAKYWYERVEDKRYLGGAANNLAFIYLDLGDFVRAHESVDLAITSFENTGQMRYLAHAYDTKAQVYLRENQFGKAQDIASQAIAVLHDGQHKETLARAMITKALALSATNDLIDALMCLDQSRDLAESVGSNELLFDVTQARVDVAEKLLQLYDIDRINLTMRMTGGSFRAAAEKLGITHPRLSRWIKKYKLKWNGNKPRRSIFKPSK